MGNFTTTNRLQLSDETFFKMNGIIKQRMNMQKIKLRLMAVITQQLHEPFQNYLTTTREPHKDSMTRFNVALLEIIKIMFNLT